METFNPAETWKSVAVLLLLMIPSLFSLEVNSQQLNFSSGYDYGYEFGYVNASGVQSVVHLYNVNVVMGSPGISIQENVCLNVGYNVFVQNVIRPEELLRGTYSVQWQTSVFCGIYKTYNLDVQGNVFNLTITWNAGSGGVYVNFYLSNMTHTWRYTQVIPGKSLSVLYDGYTTGTVVVGYGNGDVADLGKGFNVSIRQYYLYDGKWYVPPVAFSGLPSTGESAHYGDAYAEDGEVWVTFGNEGVQRLYNYSVVIVNNTVFTFPEGSLWREGETYFVNCTELSDSPVSPVCYHGNPMVFRKAITLRTEGIAEVDGVKGDLFYLPFPEDVYVREGEECVQLWVNGSVTLTLGQVNSSTQSNPHIAPNSSSTSYTPPARSSSTGLLGSSTQSEVTSEETSSSQHQGIFLVGTVVVIALILTYLVTRQQRDRK